MMSEDTFQLLHQWTEQAMLRSMSELFRFNQAHNFSFSQANTLLFFKCSSPVTFAQLTAHLGVTKAAVSQLVDRLVEQGFVERQEDPRDRRSVLLSLSSNGLQLVADANRTRQAWMANYSELFTSEESARLKPALTLLLDKLSLLE